MTIWSGPSDTQRYARPQCSHGIRIRLTPRSLWMYGLLPVGCLVLSWTLLAGAPAASPGQPRIVESDISPQDRPVTLAQPLDGYLARLQEMLKQATAPVQDSGLVEVKSTIRRDGSVTFSEIVVLEGPAVLRNELLPLVDRLGPLPRPPTDADMLLVSVLLSLRYPGPDLLDIIDREP